MTEQNNITKEYLITEYQEDFVDFLNHYGRVQHGESFFVLKVNRTLFNQPPYFIHRVVLNSEFVADINFEFEVQPDGQLKVTAKMCPAIPAMPLKLSALRYFSKLDKAIVKKYRPATNRLSLAK